MTITWDDLARWRPGSTPTGAGVVVVRRFRLDPPAVAAPAPLNLPRPRAR